MNSKRGSQFLTILPRPIFVCFLVFAYRSPGLQVFRRLSCVDHDCQQCSSPYLQDFYPIWDSVSFHFCLREASLESWPRPRESLLYFSLPRLAVLFPRRRLYCNGTYYEGQQWIVEASLRPLEAAQSLCCDGADGAGGAGVSGPKDEATGLQSEGTCVTLLGGIFSER